MKDFASLALLGLVAACGSEPPPPEPAPEEPATLDRAVQVTSDQATQIAEILTRDGQRCDAVETLAPQPPLWRIVCLNEAGPRTTFTYDPAKKLLLEEQVSPAEALRPTLAIPE